jgi:hypothetical protein
MQHQGGRNQVKAIVMGDFNSIVGEGSINKVEELPEYSVKIACQ